MTKREFPTLTDVWSHRLPREEGDRDMQGADWDAEREMKLWVGPTQPRPEVSMRQAGTTAAIGSFPFATRLLPLPRSAPSPILEKKKKGKERLLLPSLPTQVWPLADVAGRPQRAASPAPLPAPSSGSGPTAIPKLAEAALRRMRAVGQPRAQPLPALWWKCGSGSLLCSPAGRGGW